MTHPIRYAITAAMGCWATAFGVIAANTVGQWVVAIFMPILVGLMCSIVCEDDRK